MHLTRPSGPRAALAEVEKLERDGRLSGYQYLPAVKADLLSRLGRAGEAADAYRAALALAGNESERHFLQIQIQQSVLRTDRGACWRPPHSVSS
jgi:RNA polymerase sigma-70 factor (ECF subfamily)